VSVTGIVLAGGGATRFGGPKLTTILEGRSLLTRSIESVATLSDEVIVAGPALPADLADPSSAHIPIGLVPDDEPGAGPMAALAGALRTAMGDVSIVVGGDMPGLVPAVLRSMLSRVETDPSLEAAILEAPADLGGGERRRQSLPLACRTAVAARKASDALAAGDRSLQSLLDRLAYVEIPETAWVTLDPAASTLLDVDTPSDLERIRGHER
jgi:molybdopterin-guanine dinucleotide biosynthesis protein A